MGIDDEISEKAGTKLFYYLRPIFGEALEKILEMGLWGFLLKFYFGLHWKNLVAIVIIIVLLSVLKKYFYKEDLYLAFAILMLFQESPILGYMLFIYLSYFRGLFGLIKPEMRESKKFSILKSKALCYIGQYLAPIGLLIVARKNKELKDNLFFLSFLMFLHHLNYYFFLILDILLNKKNYTKHQVKKIFESAIKDTKINMLITIFLFILFKGIIIKYVYEIVSWGFLDKLFEILSWIV